MDVNLTKGAEARKNRYTEGQIIKVLKEHESGQPKEIFSDNNLEFTGNALNAWV